MLKVFRDNLKNLSWVLWAVIAVFILLVFVDFGGGGPQGGGAGDAAAWVGDEKITWGEFQRQYQNLERQFRDAYGDQYSSELAEQLQLPLRAIEQLVNEKVALAEAREMGLMVTDAEVREEILSIPGFVDEQGRFLSEEQYRRVARANGFAGPGDLEEAVRSDLLLGKLNRVLTQNIHVTEQQVEDAYREEVERARVRYLALPRTLFSAEVDPSAEELESYYEAHREEYRLPERRTVDYLLVEEALLRAQMEISEEELRRYYEENPEEFTREAQVRARHILLRTGGERTQEQAVAEIEELRRRIEGGEDFAAVAEEASEDPGSAAQGGDLGFFGRGRMVPEFEEAAFGAETGELVGPVTSPFGVHLLEVTDRRPEGKTPFAEAEAAIKNRLVSERLDEEAAEVAARLSSTVREAVVEEGADAVAAMRSAAEDHPAARFATTQPFGRGDLVPGLGRVPAFADAAFATGAGELAEEVVDTPRGPVLLRVSEVEEPQVPPLADVLPQVRQAVVQDRLQDLAGERLAALRERIEEGGATLEAAAEELGVEVVESEELGIGDRIQGLGGAPALTEAVFAAEEGELVGPLDYPQGAVLIEVAERSGFDPEDLAARRDEIARRLSRERANQLLGALVAERKRTEGVRYDRQLTEQFGTAAS